MSLANSNPKGWTTLPIIESRKFVFRLSAAKILAVAFEYLINFSGLKKNREMGNYK